MLLLAVALLVGMAAEALALPLTGPLSVMIAPTEAPVPTPTPMPTPTPPPPDAPEALAVVEEALPEHFNLRSGTVGKIKENTIAMASQGGYAQMEGVLTFRGGPYRQNAAYGYASASEGTLEIVWEKKIGALDNWSGVGWNGQPALVRWPEDTKRAMNLYEDKQAKADLVEAIYCTLDGNIYFLDLQDGAPTRDPINVGFPMKGSVSIDPRGVPLLYSGQGISRLEGRSGKIGLRIFSLIDGEELYLLNGRDDDAYRNHGAFDSVCLVDAASDTLISPSENGILYTYRLNTQFDAASGALSIQPEKGGYRYRNGKGLGVENSIAVYGRYGYFADNGGLLHCVNLNTLTPVWTANVTDDTDATVALDPQPGGGVLLFTGCEVDLQKSGGKAYLRGFNALTGELLWEYAEACAYDADVNGGLLGSPLVGQHDISGLVIFHVAKVYEGGGALIALDKHTGEVAWYQKLPRYGWSSPVAIYDGDGKSHIIVGDSGGTLRLLDGLTGEPISTLSLEGNIEGSPAVFGDMLVIGTRGRRIYGVRIR